MKDAPSTNCQARKCTNFFGIFTGKIVLFSNSIEITSIIFVRVNKVKRFMFECHKKKKLLIAHRQNVTDTYTGSPVDRRTVDRSAVSFRAATTVSCLCVRLATRRSILRLAPGGSVATSAKPVATVTESAPAKGSVVFF